MTTNVFDGELIHVMAERCSTCIFRPGNLMHLDEGRAEDMEAEALAEMGCIPCHKTIHGEREQEAICRGFYDRTRHRHGLLRLADQLGVITFDETA